MLMSCIPLIMIIFIANKIYPNAIELSVPSFLTKGVIGEIFRIFGLFLLYLLPPLFISWVVWSITGRQKSGGSYTFNIVLTLVLLGNLIKVTEFNIIASSAFNNERTVWKDGIKNIVSPRTLLSINSDASFGYIKIVNEKHILITGGHYDEDSGKFIGLCSKEPLLEQLILNGNLKKHVKIPKVTSTENWDMESDKEVIQLNSMLNLNKKTITTDIDLWNIMKKADNDFQTGWVGAYFVFKGNDALDLMDLFYKNQSVGFIVLGDKCKARGNHTSGRLIINFETRTLL